MALVWHVTNHLHCIYSIRLVDARIRSIINNFEKITANPSFQRMSKLWMNSTSLPVSVEDSQGAPLCSNDRKTRICEKMVYFCFIDKVEKIPSRKFLKKIPMHYIPCEALIMSFSTNFKTRKSKHFRCWLKYIERNNWSERF